MCHSQTLSLKRITQPRYIAQGPGRFLSSSLNGIIVIFEEHTVCEIDVEEMVLWCEGKEEKK
jgi:hypothetical protein